MRTPSIYQIKKALDNDPSAVHNFFSRGTMAAFEQTMRDFKTLRAPSGDLYFYAPLRSDGRPCGFTFQRFDESDNTLHSVSPHCATEQAIKDYIRSH